MRLQGSSPSAVPALSYLGSPDGYVVGGLPGRAGTVTVGSTTTGNAGSSASVTNSGTSNAAVLNFTVPRGDTGATGAVGPVGPTGLTGDAATVAVGSTTTGAVGSSAAVSNSGSSGAAVLNFTVPRGDVGPTGPAGTPGSATLSGFDALTLSRRVSSTARGGASVEWTKIAELNVSAPFWAVTLGLTVGTTFHSTAVGVGGESARVVVTALGRTAGVNNVVSVNMVAKSGTGTVITSDSFKVVTGVSGTVASLWFKSGGGSETFAIYEDFRQLYFGTVTYFNNSTWQSAVPTDVVEASTNGVTAFGVPVVTTTGVQTLTGKTLTNPVINQLRDSSNNVVVNLVGGGTDNYLQFTNRTTFNPHISVLGNSTNIDLSLNTKGSGVVMANNIPVATTTGAQSLTNKTIASPTITGAVTSTAVMQSVASGTSNHALRPLGPRSGYGVNASFVPGVHNYLSNLIERGGSVTATKNGSPLVLTSPSLLFRGLEGTNNYTVLTGAVDDVYVIEADLGASMAIGSLTAWGGTSGVIYDNGPAKNTKIEWFFNGAWTTIYESLNNPTIMHWGGSGAQQGNAVTKIRWTLTANAVSTFIVELFHNALYAGNVTKWLPATGGSVYGSAASPPTLAAAGADANIDLSLWSKGSGVVRANNVPVATTTGVQALTGKTISGATNTLSAIPQTAVTDLSGSLKAVMASGDNSIPSGNMEVAGLLQRPTFVSTEQFRSGTQSFKTVGHTWSNFPAALADMPLVNEGETVYGDVWVYAPTGQATTAQQVSLRIDFYNAAGTVFNLIYIPLNATTALNGVWTKIAGSAIAPAGSVRYCITLISLQLGGTEHPTHVYYWDDLRAKIIGGRVAVPASPTSPGVVGQWAAEAAWHYVCTATNTWRRTALSTWTV